MEEEDIIEKHPSDSVAKAVALYASQYIVSITTHNVTGIMARVGSGIIRNDPNTYVIRATGVIIECEDGVDEHQGTFFITILAPASLFKRTNDVPPHQLQIDVRDSGGKLFKGEVLACDFSYNLAAIRIMSDSPMPTAILRGLDDMSSIDLPQQHQLSMERPFQLLPHSSLFKILPGTRMIYLSRFYRPPYNIEVSSDDVRLSPSQQFGCNELFWTEDLEYNGNGGPIFNCFGEVIGISFKPCCFLPSNLVSRWWDHYKSRREFIRPWFCVEVSNHHEKERFVEDFPNVTGVVITKVNAKKRKRKQVGKNCSAYYSDLQPNDVIVKCDGKVVRNKLEFFEIIWDNVGKDVELNVLRPSSGSRWNESLNIGKKNPDDMHRWPLPKASVL